jgi:hypothetical protein
MEILGLGLDSILGAIGAGKSKEMVDHYNGFKGVH